MSNQNGQQKEHRLKRRGTQAQALPIAAIGTLIADVFTGFTAPADGSEPSLLIHAVSVGGTLLYGLIMFVSEKWADVNLARTATAIRDATADGRVTADEFKNVAKSATDEAEEALDNLIDSEGADRVFAALERWQERNPGAETQGA